MAYDSIFKLSGLRFVYFDSYLISSYSGRNKKYFWEASTEKSNRLCFVRVARERRLKANFSIKLSEYLLSSKLYISISFELQNYRKYLR